MEQFHNANEQRLKVKVKLFIRMKYLRFIITCCVFQDNVQRNEGLRQGEGERQNGKPLSTRRPLSPTHPGHSVLTVKTNCVCIWCFSVVLPEKSQTLT